MRIFFLLAAFMCILGCTSNNKQHYIDLYNQNKQGFRRTIELHDSLYTWYPQCYSFTFTYTRKLFWQECDSLVEKVNAPDQILPLSEKVYLEQLMHKLDIHYVNVYKNRVEFIFFGYDPYVIVWSNSELATKLQQKISDGYYLFSPSKTE